ncbi:MAG: T9SS type A sorting domain-containing protein [Candidatus Marinimicrobia bacterium]|nr:T9SS type A sorting domain-containing protein [Candidatus Neomarinimicrobiota bacterium]MBL7023694.1 T9SS type A sorting domain-containing protein [Candidatus Neomarinimicrobiota bacterium]MBL7110000.1 T9SS type A sorting domain-containing protein [Candidatus Neomarinimicrobiota bacterium]
MKALLQISIALWLLLNGLFSQTFEFHLEDATSQQVDVDSIAVFHALVTNTSSDSIHIAFDRTINDLPENWSSTMCVGESCFPSFIGYVEVWFSHGETKDFIVDIMAYVNEGTANVQISVFDLAFPDDKVITDYMATTDPLDNDDELRITNYELINSYPNPFNPSTTIGYQLPAPGPVLLAIYNVNGQLVEELVSSSSRQEAGYHSVVWDANGYSSGIYFAVLKLGDNVQMQKLSLLK